jgi:hypothetical protein
MDKEKVKELAANVNSLIGNYQDQQKNTAELFKICLEFLEDKRTRDEFSGYRPAEMREAAIKRKERKQQLIAAVKGYIEMIETREKSDEIDIPEELK